MAQLKDTVITGGLSVTDSANISNGAKISGDDLTLYTSGTGDSPALIFQRGALSDNYNDWQIVDNGGYLRFKQRGQSSTAWSNAVSMSNSGDIAATSFTGSGSNLTGIAKDVQINGSSIKNSSGVANIVTNTAYDASSNKIATMADVGSMGGGTVTSVSISGTSPISASGTVTSSGSLSVSHEASGVTAQSTQALYPFKVNATGHITSVGSAVTVPTSISDLTNDQIYEFGTVEDTNGIFVPTSTQINDVVAMWDRGFCGVHFTWNSNSYYVFKERIITFNNIQFYAFVNSDADAAGNLPYVGTIVFGISSSGYGMVGYIQEPDTENIQVLVETKVLSYASNLNPLMDGNVSVGSSSSYAREDHVHPSDTTKADVSKVGTLNYGNVNLGITSLEYSKNGNTDNYELIINVDNSGQGDDVPNYVSVPTIEEFKETAQELVGELTTAEITTGTSTDAKLVSAKTIKDLGYITDAGVTGVKGNSESSYRTGNVNITPANIGAVPTSDVTSDNNSPFGKIPKIKSDGVIELGKYIDFHLTNGDTDYALRITASADGLTLSGQSLTGSSGKLMTAGDFADRVIETGTSGSWAYRKWNSGKVEAWRTVTVTASATTQVGSVYRSTATVDLPSGLFNSTPHLITSMDAVGSNIFQVQATATSATSISVRIWRVNASSSTYGVDTSFYAWRG